VNGSQPTLKRHLWYWFFESRNAPSTDPLVIWLTGGPGCSSLVALFAENGPYIIADDLSLSLNPFSWNSNASVIWIDQPVNTGYSYAEPGDFGATSEAEIADNLYEFLQGFLSQYPKYSELPFYITGESYAGHYIPAAATRIIAVDADPCVHSRRCSWSGGLAPRSFHPSVRGALLHRGIEAPIRGGRSGHRMNTLDKILPERSTA
jgi:carboxypeptidase C (cathepsin A)